MKKMLSILMAILVIVPLVGVRAIEGNYYTYGVGDEVNFYMYEGDSTGSRTIILSDEGANSQYVRALVTGVSYASSSPWLEDPELHPTIDPADFKQVPAYKELQSVMNIKIGGASFARNAAEDTSLLTLDDLINVFGAQQNGSIYTIDWAKWGHVFREMPTSALGIYTQTLSSDKKNIWVVKFQKNDAGEVTNATVEQVPIDQGNFVNGSPTTTYAYMPVLYVDKTKDCIERDAADKFACYECDDDYVWTEVGTQGASCKKIDKIKVQKSCVKNVKTGIDEYFVQFGMIAGVCALALVIVNRKNLFKSV